jgi:ZIP family zinc transporter
MALIVGLATVVSTSLGGLFAVRFKDRLHLILGFSAGAVLGVALFDLLPESAVLVEKSYDIRMVALLIALGFSFYLMVDRSFSLQFHGNGSNGCENPSHRGTLGAVALSLHSFLDGLGIGLAFKVSPTVGWVVAAAVLTHDFSDGINTVSIVLANKGRRRQALGWLLADALAPAVGVTTTLFFSVSQTSLGLILAVFGGLFLYIGASHLIPESHHNHPTIWTSIMTILGISVLYGATRFAG